MRAKIYLVVILALLGVAGGIVYALSQPAKSQVEMRIQLMPLGENATAVALGISAPKGPIAAEFYDSRVVAALARKFRRSEAQISDEIGIEGIPGDTNQLIMAVANTPHAQRLLRAWYAAVQMNRRAVISQAIEQTRAGYIRGLDDRDLEVSRRDALENIARLTGLEGSLKTDVAILRDPSIDEVAARSAAVYALLGGLTGAIAGLLLALGVGMLERKLRTPAALTGHFGLPVVADLREGAIDTAGLAERLKAVAHDAEAGVSLLIAEAGPEGTAKVAARALEGAPGIAPAVAIGPIDSAEAQAALADGHPWAIAVRPGDTRADQALDFAVELAGLPKRPLGLLLV